MTVSVSKTDNEPQPLFFVQYYFDDKEYKIDFTPPCHRNNLNKDKPRQIMLPSVRNEVKSLASEPMKGKQIFQKLCNKAGGFSGARTPTDIPNSTEKIHDICGKTKDENKNDLVEILDICKEQKGKPNEFVRDVRIGPEITIFLSSNQQLKNIFKFCVQDAHSVLSVDATFNICSYNVTISTYCHPFLKDRKSGEHPVMIGPSIIHCHKTYESYFLLPSDMLRVEPKLQQLKVYGTDGETGLFNVFKACFLNADHLLCTIHAKDNIRRKCDQLGIDAKSFIKDIFGLKSGEIKVAGLIDCFSEEEFDAEYERLHSIWKTMPKGFEFIQYKDKYKKQYMKTSMLASVRERYSLGSPAIEYNQNCNESINSMIKGSKGPHKLTLIETVQLLQKEANLQEEKVKLAINGKGKIK